MGDYSKYNKGNQKRLDVSARNANSVLLTKHANGRPSLALKRSISVTLQKEKYFHLRKERTTLHQLLSIRRICYTVYSVLVQTCCIYTRGT